MEAFVKALQNKGGGAGDKKGDDKDKEEDTALDEWQMSKYNELLKIYLDLIDNKLFSRESDSTITNVL